MFVLKTGLSLYIVKTGLNLYLEKSKLTHASRPMNYPLTTAEQLRQQLRSLRKQRHLTQASLGALIGVTQARVVEIEANPGLVSLQQVMQVLHALGAGFLLRDGPADASPAPSAGPGAGVLKPRRAAARTAAKAPTPQVRKGSW